MVVEFSVQNFRSIMTLQTISFAATGLKSSEEYTHVDDNNIFPDGDQRLIKTLGIYGSNGSGKSNIVAALDYFLRALKNEASATSDLSDLFDPFLFQSDCEKTETFFQIVILLKGRKFRYGFTVAKNRNINIENESREIITNEWLFGIASKNMSEYFTRKGTKTNIRKLLNAERIPSSLPYEHSLFITHAAAFDKDGICAEIRQFLRGRTISNFSYGFTNFRRHSFMILEVEKRKEAFINLLSTFNLRYDDITIKEEKEIGNKNDRLFSPERVEFWKKVVIDKEEKLVKLNLVKNESAGTQKLFDLAGFLLSAFNMPKGGLIILDEVDSNFHPSLLIKLVMLFNDPEINTNNCQLLFTSHDTNLLSPKIMRRDQFYFAEKLENNSTRFYSLADLRGIRNDADFAKQYLAGFYGAIPTLENYINESTIEVHGTMEP